jgi:hypothetical protein
MFPKSSIESLRHIKDTHKLTNADIAGMCCVTIKAVESWFADPESASHRRVPPRHVTVLAHMLPSFLAKRKAQKKR